MSEQIRKNHPIPWDMPEDIFWDHGEDADLNRLQWIWDNMPEEMTLEDVLRVMPFRDEVLSEFFEDNSDMLHIIEAGADVTNSKPMKPFPEREFNVAAQALKDFSRASSGSSRTSNDA